MNIKVGIVDNDNSFVKRFSNVMNSKYDDLEVFIFPSLKQAQTAAKKSILHLLLVDSSLVGKSSYNSLIPLQCKVAILTNEKMAVEDCPLPSVCKYKSVDEWYVLICQFCSSEVLLDVKGGEANKHGQNKTCLFIPGDASAKGAMDAATEFSHFLYEKGFLSVVLNPFLESGESLWTMVEAVKPNCKVTNICLHSFDDDSIVIPFLNADAVVYVTNGEKCVNKVVEELVDKLPSLAAISSEEAYEKSYLLYNQFDSNSGTLINTDKIGKLGGIDGERNSKAAFEKLVTILHV